MFLYPFVLKSQIFKLLRSLGIDSKESISPAYLAAGRYDNPVPTRFLAPIDRLKIPAQNSASLSFLTFLLASFRGKKITQPRISPQLLISEPTCQIHNDYSQIEL